MTLYTDGFYDQITEGSIRSARIVLPHFARVFRKPESVVDLGCGRGAWLAVWNELGVEDLQGIDGDYVNQSELLIDNFTAHDLSTPLNLDRKFDLAMSLEVAEHLPESAADTFVESLTSLSDTILFSAAVPGQNGVGHINERWPSYWVPKFLNRGYTCSSNFRFDFWHNEDVENWYRQNILVFAKVDESKILNDRDTNLRYFMGFNILDVIHYNNWMGKI